MPVLHKFDSGVSRVQRIPFGFPVINTFELLQAVERRLPLVGRCHQMIGPFWSKKNGVTGWVHWTVEADERATLQWFVHSVVFAYWDPKDKSRSIARYMMCGGETQSPMDITTSGSCVISSGKDWEDWSEWRDGDLVWAGPHHKVQLKLQEAVVDAWLIFFFHFYILCIYIYYYMFCQQRRDTNLFWSAASSRKRRIACQWDVSLSSTPVNLITCSWASTGCQDGLLADASNYETVEAGTVRMLSEGNDAWSNLLCNSWKLIFRHG